MAKPRRLKMLKPQVSTLKPKLAEMSGTGWRAGKTTTERGYGYRWQQARARFLRAHPLCCYCERQGLVRAAAVVDHIVPHHGDDTLFWDEKNWQPLCKPCHDGAKAAEERGARQP